MCDHGSIGLFLGNGLFLVGNLALSVLGLFLFCFCLVWGEQVTDAQDFGWQSKGEDHFRSWFPFFYLVITLYLFRCRLVQRHFCLFLLFSSDLWSRIVFPFYCFLPLFYWEFFFFAFSLSLIGNFPSFFFWGQGLTFSPWVKVYDKLGFWLMACRTASHDICQGVGLASDLGIKGMSHIISMTQMQQWWFGNFMQN